MRTAAALIRLIAVGLAVPGRMVKFPAGSSAAHPPCGGRGAPPSARCSGRLHSVIMSLRGGAATVTLRRAAVGSSPSAVSLQLQAGLQRALDDPRRIDELVAQFEYSGHVAVPHEGMHYDGQGAVKRFLSSLLVRQHVRRTYVDDEHDCIVVELDDATGASREIQLHPTTHGSVVGGFTLIHELNVVEASAEASEETLPSEAQAGLPPLFSNSGVAASSDAADGPKWETHDGRVHQKIWQEEGLFERGNTFLVDTMQLTTGRLVCMVDSTVWELYGEQMRAWADSVDIKLDAIVARANEDHKTLDTFAFLLDELARTDPLRRSEPVLAVGGGVLTDTAGFACACWRRGIPWCRMPTTLLGMVDASVGIKVAINYHRKNGVGHFYSPQHTFIDQSFLSTVPTAEVRSGVGEIMKAALIHDVRLYDLMNAHGERLIKESFRGSKEADQVIKLSIDAMLECIGPDLWEEALLRPMDFGHSFSRTLEADERFYLRHGEAVAIDCIMNALIAEEKGLLPTEEADALLSLYARLGLPCSIRGISAATYTRARDEITVHRDGLLRAPLPAGIGCCRYVDSMSDDEIDAAFARLERFMAAHPETSWDPSKSFAAEYADNE
jgi:3-dehydroquinate synthetase